MSSLKRYADGRVYECRKNGKVYYIYWTENRRSRRKSTGAGNLRDAQVVFNEFCDMLDEQKTRDRGYTCEQIWNLRYGNDDGRAAAAWKNLGPYFGKYRPREVTGIEEDAYRVSRNAAPSTIRLELCLLRASWNHAVKKRVLHPNDLPVMDPLPDPSPPRERWLDDDELSRLFAAAERPGRERIRMFLYLALHTAARRTAIEELTWKQVDFQIGVIHYLPPGAKQTRKRKASVPISKTLRPVLEEAYRLRTSDLVIGPGGHVNESLSTVARAAGVEGVTPHVLRHTAATIMARNGVSLWVIANILGNTVEQVENVYAKWVPGRHMEAVDVIGRSAA